MGFLLFGGTLRKFTCDFFPNGLFTGGLFTSDLFPNGLFTNSLFTDGLFTDGLLPNGLFTGGLILGIRLPIGRRIRPVIFTNQHSSLTAVLTNHTSGRQGIRAYCRFRGLDRVGSRHRGLFLLDHGFRLRCRDGIRLGI
ncbi:MAG: hypothetical protein IJK97_03550 [Thermoguttaceae bacterium]|nr:hypothetical protein [Thermoguttaceae bacterium]MBQ9456133.1 hypothetical protein [Thermoguttaceae bacterium]